MAVPHNPLVLPLAEPLNLVSIEGSTKLQGQGGLVTHLVSTQLLMIAAAEFPVPGRYQSEPRAHAWTDR